MKKILYLIAIPALLLSCKKNEMPPLTTLEGSSWSYHPDRKHYETLEFSDDHQVHVTGNLTGNEYSKHGTYTYDKNYVMIELKDGLKAGYATAGSLILNDPVWAISFPDFSVACEYIKD